MTSPQNPRRIERLADPIIEKLDKDGLKGVNNKELNIYCTHILLQTMEGNRNDIITAIEKNGGGIKIHLTRKLISGVLGSLGASGAGIFGLIKLLD